MVTTCYTCYPETFHWHPPRQRGTFRFPPAEARLFPAPLCPSLCDPMPSFSTLPPTVPPLHPPSSLQVQQIREDREHTDAVLLLTTACCEASPDLLVDPCLELSLFQDSEKRPLVEGRPGPCASSLVVLTLKPSLLPSHFLLVITLKVFLTTLEQKPRKQGTLQCDDSSSSKTLLKCQGISFLSFS